MENKLIHSRYEYHSLEFTFEESLALVQLCNRIKIEDIKEYFIEDIRAERAERALKKIEKYLNHLGYDSGGKQNDSIN